jgi:nicotinate-nucleotide adenylyltransferase
MKKIGLFGGTFDPIHCGHLNLAFELLEKASLEEVWFIPAQLNPHKISLPTPIEHRLAMVELAIRDIPFFRLKDLEQHRHPPSYTIETLRIVISQTALEASSYQFYLLMGEDMVSKFIDWHLPEEIIKLTPLLIGSRSGIFPALPERTSPSIREAIAKGLILTRVMDISASDIRDRLTKRLYCGHLLSPLVLSYIHFHQLYPLKRI